MWLAALLLAFVIPSAFSGHALDDEYDLWVAEQELDERERSSSHVRHHLRHKHHRQKRRHHHRHRRKPFLHSEQSASLLQGPAADALLGAAKDDEPTTDLLLERNPAVEAKLEYMDHDMQDLKGKEQYAEQVRGNLESEVKAAMRHMNEAQGIKIKIARIELAIQEQHKKLARLAEDRLRLDKSHHHLVASLRHIMDPKIGFVETRLKEKEKEYKELENKEKQWNAKKEQFHAASIATIDERRASSQNLQVAIAAEEQARHARELAEKHLSDVKRNVNYNVEGFRFSLAKARAAESQEKLGKEDVKEAKTAVKRLTNIMNMEQRRVDESMAIGKDRVQGKIRELEEKTEKSKAVLSRLMQEFKHWEDVQRQYGKHLEATQKLTKKAAQEYATHQEAVLHAASEKVVADAEGDSSWADDDNSDWAKSES